MLSAEERTRLVVVLVGARNPQNIGAAARAMQDFGFSDLRVVNEFAPPFEAAQLEAKSAVGAGSIMAAARRFDNLAEAIADCVLVAGTTAIGNRELNREVRTLQETAPELLAGLGAPDSTQNRVALLFGSEKTGLTNQQLSYCQLLLTIPLFDPAAGMSSSGGAPAPGETEAVPRHLSMNLGQAVAVCLYELTRGGFEQSRALPELHHAPATAADRERLTERLFALMLSTGYARRFPANAREPIVRQLAQRLAATRDEAATWMGLFRQIERAQKAEADGNEGPLQGWLRP